MNRAEKFHKLANAVKNFRGRIVGGKWDRAPQPDKMERVIGWIQKLGFNQADTQTIYEFTIYCPTQQTMGEFLRLIQENKREAIDKFAPRIINPIKSKIEGKSE